jgi:hypothetical protein
MVLIFVVSLLLVLANMKMIRLRYRYLSVSVLLLFPALAVSHNDVARKPDAGTFICGTGSQREANALAKGRYYDSRMKLMERLGRRPLYQAATPSASADSGDVAVVQDDGSVLTDVNPFNLAVKAVRFERQISGAYRVVASSTAYDPTSGTTVTLEDDDTAQVPLGFSFNFFGKYYDRVQLNSDGNLTLGAADKESSARDLARFLSGPPRIAPFFTDLNPESGGGISYHSVSDGIVFTWNGVPDYDSASRTNFFNVKLFSNGNIEYVYGTMGTLSAVVGIAPGGNLTGVNAVDYAAGLPTADLNGALVEVFSQSSDISEAALARLFLKTHPDEFDQLVVFLAYDFTIPGAFAYELNVMNEVQGIGLGAIDYTQSFGSNGRLRSFVLMGSLDGLNRFPPDPTQKFFRTYNTLEVVAHEVAHRWLAHPLLQDGTTDPLALLHATDRAHWSFFFNADGSVMEGNKLVDQGEGRGDQRFVTGDPTNKYSDFDRYLMGFGTKESVPAMFFVQDPTGTTRRSDSLPSASVVSFGGTRRDFTIDNIISANGPRIPSALQSPKVYRQAFILLTRPGQQATSDQIQKLQRIRNAFVSYFNQQTGGVGYSVTSLQNTPGTTPARVYFPYFQGNGSRYTGIAVANWGATPADVEFRAYSNSGSLISSPANIINPRMITIPAGAQIALLAEQIHGLSLDDPRSGWIQARSSSSDVTGFFLDGDVSQNFLDGAVASNQVHKNLFFTQTQLGTSVTPGSSFTNLINVVNPSAGAANLTLTLMDDLGVAQDQATRRLDSNGRLAEDLPSLFPGIARPRTKGYVTVTSDAAVVGYQAIDTGSTVYSLPAQPASAASVFYSAQFASGKAGAAQYFTDINLINTSTQTRNVQILLVDDAGHPVGGITNPVSVVLSAGQQLRARGENIFNLPDASTASSMVEGSLRCTADGSGVIGDVTFGDARAQKYIASLPLDANPVSTLVFSQVAQGIGGGPKPYFTGIALFNPNSAAVNVTIDVYSDQGARTGTAGIQLPAGGRISKTLPELVPAIVEQVRGYIRVTSAGGPISAFELFGSQNLDFLTAVPAQPINP